MIKRARFSTALALTAAMLVGCGGSTASPVVTDAPDDEEEVVDTDPPATDPPATNPPATDPPVTDPPVTDVPATDPPATDLPVTDPPTSGLPDWASGETAIVTTDTGQLELPVELVSFCESSRSYYVAANGLLMVDEGQPGTVQQLLGAMAAILPIVIDAAPSDDFAEEPTAAVDHVAVLNSRLAEIDYELSRLEELSNSSEFLDALGAFDEMQTSLRSFLTDVCGADGDVLDEQSQNAIAVAAEAAGQVPAADGPEAPAGAVSGTAIANAASSITLEVPLDWTAIDEFVDNDRDHLVASSDIDGFYALTTPGVLVLRGLGGFRDGGFVGRVLGFEADLEEVGCAAVSEVAYDDGLYVGQERTYDCGVDGLDVRLLGGTTADESLYAMVLLVNPTGEPGVRQLIVDTFQVA